MTTFKPTDVPPQVLAAATEIMAAQIEKAGLRLEDNLRVADEGIAMTIAATEAIAATGFPVPVAGNHPEVFQTMGIDRTGGTSHPLSEVKSEEETGIEGGTVNGWALASILVNVANGWVDEGHPPTATATITELVSKVSPTTSIPALLRAARYSDPELLRLLSLINQGFDTTVNKALGREPAPANFDNLPTVGDDEKALGRERMQAIAVGKWKQYPSTEFIAADATGLVDGKIVESDLNALAVVALMLQNAWQSLKYCDSGNARIVDLILELAIENDYRVTDATDLLERLYQKESEAITTVRNLLLPQLRAEGLE